MCTLQLLTSALVVKLGIVKPVYADVDIDFSEIESASGVISYGGASSPLVGSIGDPPGDGPFWVGPTPYDPFSVGPTTICLCNLSFTTGQLTGTNATDWFFASGGSLNITGTLVSDSDISDVIVPSTTLLTGSFLGFLSEKCNGTSGPLNASGCGLTGV